MKKDEKENINFEENIKKLENIVRELESGNVTLDDALNKFNEAFKLLILISYSLISKIVFNILKISIIQLISWSSSNKESKIILSFNFVLNSVIIIV